ncbi:hypothetical protein [Yinghuangia sp. YIM S10712]|uniref:hypothetical protein n=1 Tax=Yinghuangia sp. YIM S10712 TaxID=3436930 RepID=UPI003F53B3AE
MAAAVVLGAGLTACGDDDEGPAVGGDAPSIGAPTGGGETEEDDEGQVDSAAATTSPEQRAAYRDRLADYLKSTSQGAHVTRVELTFLDVDMLTVEVDTDLTDAWKSELMMLAAEAEEWATDHREVEVHSIDVHSVGRTDTSYGMVPRRGAAQDRGDAYAAELLAFLKATPEGASVVRIRAFVLDGHADLTVQTDRKPYPTGDFSPPAAETRAIVAALRKSIEGWVQEHREQRVDGVTIMDVGKGLLELAAGN